MKTQIIKSSGPSVIRLVSEQKSRPSRQTGSVGQPLGNLDTHDQMIGKLLKLAISLGYGLIQRLFHSGDPDQPRLSQGGPSDLAVQIQAIVPGYAKLSVRDIEEDTLLIQDKFPLHPTRRLVVLVPTGKIDETGLARRVKQLAASSCFNVLYLALSSDVTQIGNQRRRLTSLAERTSAPNVHAQVSVSAERDWHHAVEQLLHPGDLLVCLASHYVSENLIRRRKLGEQLVKTVDVPIYMFGGFKIDPPPKEWQAIKDMMVWGAYLFLIAIFFGVQAIIERSTSVPLSTIMLILSLVVELYLLSKINEWIG